MRQSLYLFVRIVKTMRYLGEFLTMRSSEYDTILKIKDDIVEIKIKYYINRNSIIIIILLFIIVFTKRQCSCSNIVNVNLL